MKIYNLVLNDYQFKESFLTNKIQFKGNPLRRITKPIERVIRRVNPFRRGKTMKQKKLLNKYKK